LGAICLKSLNKILRKSGKWARVSYCSTTNVELPLTETEDKTKILATSKKTAMKLVMKQGTKEK
jgi:hypothetical protein